MVIFIAVLKILAAVAIGGMTYIALYKMGKRLPSLANSIVQLMVSAAVMLFTYYLLFWFVSLTAGRVLAPWDQWAACAPPRGTWQRQLNDFFSLGVHQYIVGFTVVGISAVIFAIGVLRNGFAGVYKLTLAFAVINLAFVLVDLVAVVLFPAPHSAADIGYQRVLPDLLTTFTLLVMFFWAQWGVISRSFWER